MRWTRGKAFPQSTEGASLTSTLLTSQQKAHARNAVSDLLAPAINSRCETLTPYTINVARARTLKHPNRSWGRHVLEHHPVLFRVSTRQVRPQLNRRNTENSVFSFGKKKQLQQTLGRPDGIAEARAGGLVNQSNNNESQLDRRRAHSEYEFGRTSSFVTLNRTNRQREQIAWRRKPSSLGVFQRQRSP